MACALVAMLGDPHDRLLLALLLGQESRDAALRGLWHARDQRPVDLARRARAEGLRQRCGRKACLGDEQAAGRVLVEPVDKTRALAVRPRRPQHLEHAVDVASGAGAALHRKPHRFVEHQHVSILMQRDRAQEVACLGVGLTVGSTRPFLTELERWNAHGLSGRKPVLRLGALAVHAQLAFANDALDVRKRKSRKACFEKAIDAHAGFVSRHRDSLYGSGSSRRRLQPVILRRPPQTALEGCSARVRALRGSLREHLRVTDRDMTAAAIMIARSGDLPSAARLPGPATTSWHFTSADPSQPRFLDTLRRNHTIAATTKRA